MNIPQNIGWKRILLTSSQKFLLDLNRLSSGQKPDKVEKIIILIEGLAPSILYSRTKRYARRMFINLYWHLMPKRLKVYKSRNPIIHEYLPWFQGSNKKVEQHLYRFGKDGKVLTASSGLGHNHKNYTYSWKKAHHLALDLKKEFEQEEIQHRLDWELKKMSEGLE